MTMHNTAESPTSIITRPAAAKIRYSDDRGSTIEVTEPGWQAPIGERVSVHLMPRGHRDSIVWGVVTGGCTVNVDTFLGGVGSRCWVRRTCSSGQATHAREGLA